MNLKSIVPGWRVDCLVMQLRDRKIVQLRLGLMWSRYPHHHHPLLTISQQFHQNYFWNSSSVGMFDNGPLWSFQGRCLSASSFYATLLKVLSGIMSFSLCLHVFTSVSSSSTLEIFWDASCSSWVFCSPVYQLGCSPWPWDVQAVHAFTETPKVDVKHWHMTL